MDQLSPDRPFCFGGCLHWREEREVWVGGPWRSYPASVCPRGWAVQLPHPPCLPLCWAQSSCPPGLQARLCCLCKGSCSATPTCSLSTSCDWGQPFKCPLHLELSSCSSPHVIQEWSAWWRKGLRILGSLPPPSVVLGKGSWRTSAFPLFALDPACTAPTRAALPSAPHPREELEELLSAHVPGLFREASSLRPMGPLLPEQRPAPAGG